MSGAQLAPVKSAFVEGDAQAFSVGRAAARHP
ncbi:MAG: hypothetical protein ACJASV_001052 [Pseudorhodobacter sp.]|jgi:hypothetical protein